MRLVKPLLTLMTAFVLATAFETPSYAVSNSVASIPANSCVPGDTTIEFDRHSIVSANVQHKGTGIDQITMYCFVPEGGFSSGDRILIRYQDSTATAGNFVHATYYRLAYSSGTLTQIVQLDTDMDCSGTSERTCNKSYSAHNQDHATYGYYVRIDIDRSSSSNTEKISFVLISDEV
jgi:hypothetical protein